LRIEYQEKLPSKPLVERFSRKICSSAKVTL
jgi:hypothetical protein